MLNYRIYAIALLSGLLIGYCAKTQGFKYDGYVDSLKKIMDEGANANERIDAGTRLAKIYYYYIGHDTTYRKVMKEVVAVAKKEKLIKQEARAIYWKSFFAFGDGSPDGVVQLRQSLDFARS
ncbi:MAG: hypothetical protein JST09_20070, partial [Bacteroidetes bacterium]|nr:hypothetical protein [Bacteroidota bacterium]